MTCAKTPNILGLKPNSIRCTVSYTHLPDPTGQLKKEVEADRKLGDKLGVQYTPSIMVCTQKEWVHVTDISLLYQTIDELKAKAGAEAPVKKAATPPAKKAATAPAK